MRSRAVSWRVDRLARRPRGLWEPPTEMIPLGSGRVAAGGIGAKAALLDEAARYGLAVPRGFVVPDHLATDDLELTAVIPRPGTGVSFAVRSAFSGEDTVDQSRAGYYLTKLRVAPEDLSEAIAEVRASADREVSEPAPRRDVLVMEMVHALHSGVAFSEPGTYDDLVNMTEGTAQDLVAGQVPGERHLLARLEPSPRGWPRRLARLLREIRRRFGDRPWDVEWADDGTRCWLVQLRAITAAPRRDEMLTIANHAEILPALPSTFMTSVIAQAGGDLFAWYRRADPRLPGDRDFLTVVAGRPFINLSLLEDLLRHLGLPTRLVADSIGGEPTVVRRARPLRMLTRSPALIRLGWAQVTAVATSRERERRAAEIPAPEFEDWTSWVAAVHSAYVGLVTGMFPLSSAIGPPLAVLRRVGTLHLHAATHRSVTSRLAEARDRAALAGAGSPAHDEFLAEFGHRGVYESDLARPRYRDDPSSIGAAAADIAARSVIERGWRWWLTRPVWWVARSPLDARERLRHEAMRGFATLRDRGMRRAHIEVAAGRLPSVEHLWSLTAEEVSRLDTDWIPDEAFWQDRDRERERWSRLTPPAIVGRFEDPETWDPDTNASDRCRGLSLTPGRIVGRAWVLDEPATTPPPGFDPASTVLVARSVDAGWIATFALVAGVVVETGGDLSHGSILLRERGLPAITNARGVRRMVATGDPVELRADVGTMLRLDHET